MRLKDVSILFYLGKKYLWLAVVTSQQCDQLGEMSLFIEAGVQKGIVGMEGQGRVGPVAFALTSSRMYLCMAAVTSQQRDQSGEMSLLTTGVTHSRFPPERCGPST